MYINQNVVDFLKIQIIVIFMIVNISHANNISIYDNADNINMTADNSLLSMLHFSVLTKDIELLTYLLNTRKIYINTKDFNGCTPLHTAVNIQEISLVEALIRFGADVNSFNYEGETPLFLAVKDQTHDIAKYLIQQGADTQIHNNNGQSLDDIAELYQNKVYTQYLKKIRSIKW